MHDQQGYRQVNNNRAEQNHNTQRLANRHKKDDAGASECRYANTI